MMKHQKLLIRPYQNKDEKDVIGLWHSCDLVVPWNNPKTDIDRKLKVNPDLFLVGLIGEQVIATVMGGYEGHRGWINYLAVAPKYQKQGFGAMMMQAIEKKLILLGCPKINLQVRVGNIASIKFYEQLGFSSDKVISMGKRLADDLKSNISPN